MNVSALACDYDGTIAHHGVVSETTVNALGQFRDSGKLLFLVTGRRLEDLLSIFSETSLFEWIVAENGAVLYQPSTKQLQLLGPSIPPHFVQALRERGVGPLELGHVIVATWEPHQNVVLDVIKALGLELQVIFNKGAVMVLPTGINKATGLKRALRIQQLSPESVIAIGDAENDHAFFELCGFSVAVANALPAVQAHADFTTKAPNGNGVRECIDLLLAGALELKPKKCEIQRSATEPTAPTPRPAQRQPQIRLGSG